MHVRANPLPLLLALSLAACAAQPAPAKEPQVVAPAPGDGQAGGSARRETPLQGELAQAVEAIRRDDLDSARTILSRVLFARHMADAGAKLELGQPEAALLDTEAALALFPREEDALLLDARGRLALAEALLAGARPFAREALEDALSASLRAGDSAAARLGAARAAYLLGDSAAALTYAREGMAAPDLGQAAVDRMPQRTYAEAAYAVYAAQRAAAEPGATGQPAPSELFKETETALGSYLGRATDDPWVYAALASLYEAEGLLLRARDALLLGIGSVPRDRSLVERLADVARRAEGDAGALATFEALARAHADLPEAHWYEGYLRFQLALAAFGKKELDAAAFRTAEASFARCRALAPEYADNCIQYEVLCRDALGWCLFEAGDVDGAHAAFLSMGDLKERGLEQQLEGQLRSGVMGLALCAKAYNDRGDFLAAGEVNDQLRHFVPGEVAYANNAGFCLREAAVKIEQEGAQLCEAAKGGVGGAELAARRQLAEVEAGVKSGSPEEREALRAAADRRMGRARALMERSADAYRAAAELAPEDVRIVNDAALVLVYYLHTDLERAREMLERCVALGARQVQDPSLDKDALWALKNAWGDAHQNLGVLHAEFLKDKAKAITYFNKAVEIGPEPRPDVTSIWLPALGGEKVHPGDDMLVTKSWAEPCR